MIARQSRRNESVETAQIIIRVPESLRKELKTIAVSEDKSMNLLLEEIIVSYLEKHKSRKK